MNTNEHTEQIVPVGKNIYYDEHASISKRIVNRGSITLAPGITLEAEELINEGTIKSESGDLTLRVEKLTGSGSLTSEGAIDLSSSHDLIVNDGSFAANEVRFDCAGDLNVDARRIEGSVRIKSKNLSFGSREGDLNIIESCTEGDPIVYAEGPLTCGAFNTNNEDLALLAHGTITINGNIDTGTGTLTVGAGVSFVVTGTPQSGPCGAGSQQIDGGSYNIVSSTGVSPFILNGDIKCQGSGNAVRLIASRSEVNGALDIPNNLIVQSGNLEVNCPAGKTVDVGGFVQSVDGRVIIKAPDASSSISIMGQITAPKQTIILVAGDFHWLGATNSRVAASHR